MGNTTRTQIGRVAVVALAVATFLSPRPARAQFADPVAVTNQCLVLMNQERAKVGAPALVRQCELEAAAVRHVNDMVTKNFFDHTGSDGSTGYDRVRQAGFTGPVGGDEILAAGSGTRTAEGAIETWRTSPGHWQYLVHPRLTQVGIAVAYKAGTQYGYYWCVVFGLGGRVCPPGSGTGGTVQQPRSLGGVATAPPRAAYDADGRLYVFVRGTDGGIYYRSRGDLYTNWADWKGLGRWIQGNLSLAAVNGRLAVFARGGDNELLYTVRQGDGFAPMASLGGILTSDPVAEQVDGRAHVFVRGTNGIPFYRGQSDWISGNPWGNWTNLGGGITGAPMVTRGSDRRLIILARGGGGLWLRQDPRYEFGQPWRWIGFDVESSRVDPVLAPGTPSNSPVFLWSVGADLWWGYQNRAGWLSGAAGANPNPDAPTGRAITSKIAVAVRPAGGFYLAARRDGGVLTVHAATLNADLGLVISNIGSASNIPGAGDLGVVTDSRDGRLVVFSLNASGGLEERWF